MSSLSSFTLTIISSPSPSRISSASSYTGVSYNFQVAGKDRVFYPAKAWIQRSKMLVKSERVPHPVAVRYGFENYVEGDLFGEDLPVSSFRSDDW